MTLRSVDGYYDENGRWQRTKLCNVQCQNCTCNPPMGLYQLTGAALEAHQEELRALAARDAARAGVTQ